MEILLNAERIATIGPLDITNTLVASTVVVLFFIFIAFKITRTKYDLKNKFYNFIEMVIEGFLGVVESVVGRGVVAKQIIGVVMTFFLFIMFNNWFGIFPGMGSIGFYEPKEHIEAEGHTVETPMEEVVTKEESSPASSHEAETTKQQASSSEVAKEEPIAQTEEKTEHEKEGEMVFVPLLRSANSDLNMTLAIALVSVIFIQIITIKNIGGKNYILKFFNIKDPIMLFVGLLEIISEIIKIFSFSFRLFGNIFAGDVLLIVIFGLAPYLAPIPFMGIEMFAGFIQALIFSMLTLVFINVSVAHGEH